jgi:translation initiation factor IF-2
LISENERDSELKQEQSRRLSLSKESLAMHSRKNARVVTVEVRRKRVSLLEKKRALESGGKAVSTSQQGETEKPVVHVGTLSEEEVSSRIRAVQNAQKNLSTASETIEELEELQEKVKEDITDVATDENVIKKPETNQETENNKINIEKGLVQEQSKEVKISRSGRVKKKNETVSINQLVPKTSVILRAASYGEKKDNKIKELTKNKSKTGNIKDREEDRSTNIKTQMKGKELSNGIDVASSSIVSESKTFGKIKAKKYLDTESIEKSPRRSVRKLIEEPRKLSRRVLTRVLDDEEENRMYSISAYKRAQKRRSMAEQKRSPARVIRDVTIAETITVGELANRMAIGRGEVIKALMKLGITVSINQVIDGDTAELVCGEFGHRVKRVSNSDIEIEVRRSKEDKSEDLVSRPPVVTVMGHVDHGKTSLLDALRETDIVSKESGGITQHIGAYQIVTLFSEAKITFIDTPGHAAFGEMRARGANITDIVILVVAADDGVKEQTVEAISHAKAAKVPIILAINKIDKPAANPQQVKNELLNYEIVTEDFGGDVIAIEVSAKNGTNLDKLVEAILLQAEILELKANINGAAEGVVIEASIDSGRGITATLLIQRGTLKQGDIIVAGSEFGRVKVMKNFHNKKLFEASVSCPIEILGFNGVPLAGEEFFVVADESKAREIAEQKRKIRKEKEILARNKNSIEDMMKKISAGELNELPVVLKADVQGTLEAIANSIRNLRIGSVTSRIIHMAVGDINETDIMLAKTSGAVVLGFHVKATQQARNTAEKNSIIISYHSVVYDLLDYVAEIMKGQLAPTFEEQILGKAEIRVVFSKGKVTKIAGCYVLEGLVRRSNSQIRVFREKDLIFTGKIDTMKREKDDIKESKEGYECGIIIDRFNDIKEGDIIECFEIVEKGSREVK